MTKLTQLLSLFGLREIEMKLYESLFFGKEMGASELAKQAGVSRTSVYDLIKRLKDEGLVIEGQKNGTAMFSVQPPEKLQLLLAEKEKELVLAKSGLAMLQTDYLKQNKTAKPKLQLFEGRQELQQMMKDLLLYRDITVHALWPIETITKLLTAEFMAEFHKKRAERNITLKVIWPAGQLSEVKKHSFLKDATQKRQAKIAPAHIDFSLGYTIYNNTVRFISSSKENFGFLVESAELAAMMKSQWEIIWNLSRPIK